MGIISFSHCFSRTSLGSALLAPLQTLSGLFGSIDSRSAKAVRVDPLQKITRDVNLHTFQTVGKDLLASPCVKSHLKSPNRRLKIVRQVEAGASSLCAGRMTLTGSMADVCAELDRMAHREAVSYRN